MNKLIDTDLISFPKMGQNWKYLSEISPPLKKYRPNQVLVIAIDMNQEVTQYQKNLTNTKGEILFTLNCLVIIASPIVISILSNKYPLYQSHMLILSDMLPLTISTIYYPLMLYIIAPELRRFILKCWNIPIFKSIELINTCAQKKVYYVSRVTFRTLLRINFH